MSQAPVGVRLRTKTATLELTYADGRVFSLPAEFLRVYSPSAEVKGHGVGQQVLQTGKSEVRLSGIESTGRYGVRLIFDDGHDTGIYSWEYLYELCVHQEAKWQDYLVRLREAGASRHPLPADTQVINIINPAGSKPDSQD